MARYLPTEGWDVTVVTADLQGAKAPTWSRVVETGYTDVVAQAKRLVGLSPTQSTYTVLGETVPKVNRRASITLRQRLILNGWRLVTYPDPMRGWYRHAVNALTGLITSGDYSAIISTSPPITTHLAIARALHGKLPWLADFRDLWAGNPYHPGRLRYLLDKALEVRTLSQADAITTVSQPLADLLARTHPGKPTFAVPNAFDPTEWDQVPFVSPTKCTLTYAGQLRDPYIVFEALASEQAAGIIGPGNFELNLYTNPTPWLISEIEDHGLTKIINLKGTVPRDDVLRAERSSSANLVISSFLPGEEAGYTGKLFEYLGAGRPIIAVGPEGSVIKDLLEEVGDCWYASTIEQMRSVVRAFHRRWQANGELVIQREKIEQFTARNLAKRFSEILDQITQRAATP